MKNERGSKITDCVEIVGKWYDRFIESGYFTELSEIQKDKAWGIMEFFAQHASDNLGASPADWDEQVLEECCLDIMPRKVSAEAAYFEAVAPVLGAFFCFLESEKILQRAGLLAARVKQLGPEITRAAADGSNWGPAKSFAMDAIRAGVDLQDEASMQRHMMEYNLQHLKRMAELEESGQLPETSAQSHRNLDPYPHPNPPIHRSGPKLGRNDPCHCGSGKKYKKCHMALDEKDKVAAGALPKFSSLTPPPEPEKEASSYRAMYNEMKAEVEPVLNYMNRREEIEAASTILESHRDEFNKFSRQKGGQEERIDALFSDPRFEEFRFSAEDVERAFKKVGRPSNSNTAEKNLAKVNEAICFLADKARRSRISMGLMLHLPHYVNAGQYVEGWLIQQASVFTAENQAESNPFLFVMFDYGYQALVEQQDSSGEAVLREVGLDPEKVRNMTPKEIDAWVAENLNNPATREKMESIMGNNPRHREQAIALCEEAEEASLGLLEREDARELMLSRQEIETWLPIVNERLQGVVEAHPELLTADPTDEKSQLAFQEAIVPIFAEVAEKLFTPQRIQQLVSQLLAYRDKLFAAGDKGVSATVMAAVNSLKNEDEPALNRFLVGVCYTSLTKAAADGR